MSVQCADDVTLHDLLIYDSQVFSYRLLEFRATNSSFETSKDLVMEANRACDTYLAHSNSPPFALSYAAMHRHAVGLEGQQRREVGGLQQCVPIRQGHLKWIGMRGEKQFPQDENREQLMKK